MTSDVKALQNIPAKAQAIVDKYQGKPVDERLAGYKDEICGLVSYDFDAIDETKEIIYGNPWQIIYVFDGDKNTNVVCEGYAKAFQYLCDLDGGEDFECYTVSGVSTGGNGAGPHMWNIVRINNKSYFVDVTNCDENSIGTPDKLFLKAPTSGDVENGYEFVFVDNIILTEKVGYVYNSNTIWDKSILTLAGTDYSAGETPTKPDEPVKPIAVTGVSMVPTIASLKVNETVILTAAVAPANAANKTVRWNSSNASVATVNATGQVTAVAPGTATITVTTVDGGKTATCTVTVQAATTPVDPEKPTTIPVTGVSLNETALSLEVNGTAALTATVSPENATNKAVRWSSSNASVATVNTVGQVTAIAPGTATITATTEDGGKTAICTVTVTERKIPVTSITLNESALSLEVKNNAQLTARVLPADTTSKIAWASSNEKVALVDNTGKVTAVGKGAAVISAAADGIKAECAVTVTADTVYAITFDTDGGTLAGNITNPDYVTKGEGYKMPGASKSGYTLTAWAIGAKTSENKVKANEVYTFTADTTVYAVWERVSSSGGGGGGSRPATKPGAAAETKPGAETGKPSGAGTSGSKEITAANIASVFADVQNNAWYSEAIAYVYNNKTMNGTEKGFEPGAATTRAMIVTMLHRLAGEPGAGAAQFADVPGGQWFSEAVAWAAANGVVNGYSETQFAPNEAVTREQLAVILYRYAEFRGYDVSVKGDLSAFSDSGEVSAWAAEAMQWAVGKGVINGDNGALRPFGNATRAEVAMMFMRYLENVVK